LSKRLLELSILTADLPGAVAAWGKASGLNAEVSAGQGRITAGDVLLRLVSPAAGAREASLVAERGEGMYELVIEADDLVAAMADLTTKAIAVSGIEPGEGGRREIRVDPASTHGVPIRLVEKT
jgi:hypothetical protein